MAFASELSGDLPLDPDVCPEANRNLDYFFKQCQQNQCIHEKYNHDHFVSKYNLTLFHDSANWNEGAAPNVAKALNPQDIMFFSIGAWINYDIKYHIPKIRKALLHRPRNGECIVWIGMSHVGHLKQKEHLQKGQNNTNAIAFNDYMQQHYAELGFDGYASFFNLTRDADRCAQHERDVGRQRWANFDETHATAEPNRMIYLGLLIYLQNHLQVLKDREMTATG